MVLKVGIRAFWYTYIKGYVFVCVGVEFIAFNVFLRIKSEQKVIFCTNYLQKSVKKKISIRNILLNLC